MRVRINPDLDAVLSRASAAASRQVDRERVIIPSLVVLSLSASTLLAGCGAAGSAAALIGDVCLTVPQQCNTVSPPTTLGYGMLGALLVRGAEAWRRDGCAAAGTSCSTRSLLTQSILVGTLPLQIASTFAGDAGVAERAAAAMEEEQCGPRTGLLQLVGAAAACAWTQGVVQHALTSRLASLAVLNAARLYPQEPESTWWWPAVAAGTAISPFAAAALAAALAASLDGLIAQTLCPVREAESRERFEAVEIAIQRGPRLFELEGMAPDAAARRAADFERAARDWQHAQLEHAWRCDAAACARAGTAALVYAASGGSALAALVASLGAIDASGLAALRTADHSDEQDR